MSSHLLLECANADVDRDLLLPTDENMPRLGPDICAKVDDEIALAWVDEGVRQILLYRDISGQIPLFYARSGSRWLFATHPLPIAAVTGLEVDMDALAHRMAHQSFGRDHLWKGVKIVKPGETICLPFDLSDETIHAFSPPPLRLEGGGAQNFADEYLAQLDQTIARQIDRADIVATHLSSGLDSSGVTARAASQLGDPSRVTAITAAPGADGGKLPRGRVGDESDCAKRTADRLGVRHIVMRHEGPSIEEVIQRESRLRAEPCWHPHSARWWDGTRDIAQKNGAKRLLVGEMGNITLNWGGLPILRDYWQSRGPLRAAREILLAKIKNPVRWRGIAAALFPRLGKRVMTHAQPSFLRHPISAEAGPDLTDNQALRVHVMIDEDLGMARKAAQLGWGLLERDPTASKAIVNWSLALPPEAFLKDGIYRPMSREALSGQIPDEVFDPTTRGMQITDWAHWFTKEVAERLFEIGKSSPLANKILDFDAMKSAIENWPEKDHNLFPNYGIYAVELPTALSVGHFLGSYLPEIRALIRPTSEEI